MSSSSRTVLITGASKGIGKAIAMGLAESGFSCVLVARGEYELQQTLNEIEQISVSRQHYSHAMDVSEKGAWESFLRAGYPTITDVVCSAGIYGPIGNLGTFDIEEFQRTINVNLMGSVRTVTALLPSIKRSKGTITIIAGGGAASPNPKFTAYGTSKAALVRFAENISREFADDELLVNTCAPGFINTSLHQETLDAGVENAGEAFFEKTQKVMTEGGDDIKHVVDLCRFLVTPSSDRFNGKFISAVWDDWRSPNFRERLRKEDDLASLRRIDDMYFSNIQK